MGNKYKNKWKYRRKKSLYKSNNLEVSICQFWYVNPYFSAQPEIS